MLPLLMNLTQKGKNQHIAALLTNLTKKGKNQHIAA
jgi:hypothetical protein